MKAIIPIVLLTMPFLAFAQSSKVDLFVGTYTNSGKSEGIYVYNFDETKGDFSLKTKAVGIANPSFLALNSKGNVLYSVNESSQSGVSSFSYIDGELKELNTLKSGGSGPCHLVIDKSNQFLFASNYGGGSLSVFNINEDGSLKELIQNIKYEGSGPNKERQNGSHVHSATFSPDERFLLVQDLGTDIITIYPFSPKNLKEPLQVSRSVAVQTTPGGGPRHITFSKDGNYVYVVAELTSSVQVYSFQEGKMKLIQEIDMVPGKVAKPVGASHIVMSDDNRFLYTSNRGQTHEINIYKVDSKTGLLEDAGRQSTLGIAPRNFTLSKTGKFLLVGNQDSDEIVIFSRDKDSGQLSDTGKRIEVGSPVCLLLK